MAHPGHTARYHTRPWQTVFPREDRTIYDEAGFNRAQSFGSRPALLIVDVVYSFTGTRPMPTYEAIREYSSSCGESAWVAMRHIRTALEACRARHVPVIFTKGDAEFKVHCGGSTKDVDLEEIQRIHSTDIPDQIAPLRGEFVLRKTKASAFFASPLTTYLTRLQVDTLLICGTSTSGCVRATVVDAFSHGYSVFVIEQACFDRSTFSHLVNLYEMNCKYADVITITQALGYVKRLRPAITTPRSVSFIKRLSGKVGVR
jgi:nicotinamidase-related amidase